MDIVTRLCVGIENLDTMSKEIRDVMTRVIAGALEEFQSIPEFPGHIQLGKWWVYYKPSHFGHYRLMIRVDISAGSINLVDTYAQNSQPVYQQPSHFRVREIRQQLPEFVELLLERFPLMRERFQPFLDASQV